MLFCRHLLTSQQCTHIIILTVTCEAKNPLDLRPNHTLEEKEKKKKKRKKKKEKNRGGGGGGGMGPGKKETQRASRTPTHYTQHRCRLADTCSLTSSVHTLLPDHLSPLHTGTPPGAGGPERSFRTPSRRSDDLPKPSSGPVLTGPAFATSGRTFRRETFSFRSTVALRPH